MIPLPVTSVVWEFNVGPLSVERRLPSTQNQFGGRDAASPPDVLVFEPIAAHNLTGRDLLQVPEADRNGEVVQFYTLKRLHVADAGFSADVVTYQERRFRIVRVRDFDLQGGVYCAFGALEDVQALP